MLNSKGARDCPERETSALGSEPSTAAESSSSKESQIRFKYEVTAVQTDPSDRPYNTVIRNPANVWGEGEYGEPEGWVVNADNLETVLHASDAVERFNFGVFDLIATAEGSCLRQSLGRFIHFEGQSTPVLLDADAHVARAAGCLEQSGFTLNFAYADEDRIDYECNFRDFAMWLRTADVPEREVDLATGATA